VNKRRLITPCRMMFACILTISMALADNNIERLGAEWQEWALSIPTAVNPQLGGDSGNPSMDYATAGKCFVGQRGGVWFLAGTFLGGTAVRTCQIPSDKLLFFPVVNSVQINTPGICGQGGSISVSDLRSMAAGFINTSSNLSVDLDSKQVHNLERLQSPVFGVALPESNVFDAPCKSAHLGNVPGGIFSPAIDDGFYVLLGPLTPTQHILHIHAENSSQGFTLDVTYHLNVVQSPND